MEDEFIEERRKFLLYFCEKIAEIKFMYYSVECIYLL